jgi:hypothetical protein
MRRLREGNLLRPISGVGNRAGAGAEAGAEAVQTPNEDRYKAGLCRNRETPAGHGDLGQLLSLGFESNLYRR